MIWNDYIGTPWESGAQGPDAFDCWSFFRHVQRVHFGLHVPIITVDANDIRTVLDQFSNHDELSNWREIDQLETKEGDAVLMSQARYPSHVGLWIAADGGGVLHCVRGCGVVFTRMSALRTDGWSNIKFYRHKDST